MLLVLLQHTCMAEALGKMLATTLLIFTTNGEKGTFPFCSHLGKTPIFHGKPASLLLLLMSHAGIFVDLSYRVVIIVAGLQHTTVNVVKDPILIHDGACTWHATGEQQDGSGEVTPFPTPCRPPGLQWISLDLCQPFCWHTFKEMGSPILTSADTTTSS